MTPSRTACVRSLLLTLVCLGLGGCYGTYSYGYVAAEPCAPVYVAPACPPPVYVAPRYCPPPVYVVPRHRPGW